MIPYLGAEGAAKLQRQMTEHTLLTASKLDRDVAIEIHFTGGDRSLMQDWLGNELIYKPQTNGDLGDRMQSALASALKRGSDRVVLIGVDCPDLNAPILTEAFQMLDRHDLVLGPAADGGYYLIGLSRLVPDLFVGINWGTDRVLAQTKDIANRLQLNTHYLPILNDVDLPEDLSIWQRSLLGRGEGEK
jgi:rSAM/selenodomain-associated transferase 1